MKTQKEFMLPYYLNFSGGQRIEGEMSESTFYAQATEPFTAEHIVHLGTFLISAIFEFEDEKAEGLLKVIQEYVGMRYQNVDDFVSEEERDRMHKRNPVDEIDLNDMVSADPLHVYFDLLLLYENYLKEHPGKGYQLPLTLEFKEEGGG